MSTVPRAVAANNWFGGNLTISSQRGPGFGNIDVVTLSDAPARSRLIELAGVIVSALLGLVIGLLPDTISKTWIHAHTWLFWLAFAALVLVSIFIGQYELRRRRVKGAGQKAIPVFPTFDDLRRNLPSDGHT